MHPFVGTCPAKDYYARESFEVELCRLLRKRGDCRLLDDDEEMLLLKLTPSLVIRLMLLLLLSLSIFESFLVVDGGQTLSSMSMKKDIWRLV